MKVKMHWFISGGMCLVIGGLMFVSVQNLYNRSFIVTSFTIANDLKKLRTVLERIDATCGIMGFDRQQNYINFLNVGSFEGSEVGAMNLIYPEKWQGPYLPDNLTVQSIEYMVVKTDSGYFITPGNGVELPNGKIVGKDILLTAHANVGQMMHDKHALFYKGQSLAIKLPLTQRRSSPVNPELWKMDI